MRTITGHLMKSIFLFLLAVISHPLCAQDNDLGKRTNIVFITSEVIANENFENEEFITWVKAVQQANGDLMKTESGHHVVKIIARWAKGGTCNYDVSVCPGNLALADKVTIALLKLKSPVAKFASFQLLFSFKYNEGCNAPDIFLPVVLNADEKLKYDLSTQTLAKRKETLRNWAIKEVIPVLAYYTSGVNDQFAGVKETGKLLSTQSFLNNKAAAVTEKNPLYWRGVMEMNKGNLLIPVSKLFMHVANDEFDLARRYIGMLFRFADKESLASHYLLDLNKYLNLFYSLHDSLVHEGIALHDAGKYDEAIKKYKSILTDYPHSAWALYELYFSTDSKELGKNKNKDKSTDLWNQHKSAVYNADPLYPMGAGANNSKDGYILFRHLQVKDLFKDSKKLRSDLATYADIALDLESYAFAAHLYWYLLAVLPEEKYNGHTYLPYFLYALQKLGVSEVQSLLKTDYTAELSAIEKEREEKMKNDPIYKSFKEQ